MQLVAGDIIATRSAAVRLSDGYDAAGSTDLFGSNLSTAEVRLQYDTRVVPKHTLAIQTAADSAARSNKFQVPF